ncbi:hypothetical protein Avbf_04788 [Armadillidium vulgare]|nr:hypothetical protein Avbf_04788 [Armadillidium vulgare]
MSENGTIPENKSYELVTEKLVREALRNDKGNDAQLLSWDIKNFTNRRRWIHERYCQHFIPCQTWRMIVFREPIIFSKVMGSMSKHLSTLGLPPIKTPKFYAGSFEKGREAFLTENLRKQGFVLHDRRKGQDFNHASLVMGELGRFHASSYFLKTRLPLKHLKKHLVI